MVVSIISTDVTTGIEIGSNEELFILEGAVVSNGELATITGEDASMANVDINILGTVVSGDIAIDFFNGTVTDTTDINVFIGETGSIVAQRYAMMFDSPDAVSVVNLGTLRSTADTIQFGSLQGNISVVNAGTMVSDEAAFFISSGATAYITNTGLMFGDGDLDDEVIESNALTVLYNSGTISGYNGRAIGTFVQDDIVRNSGTINGSTDLSSGANTINNSGTMNGDVTVLSGADLITNLGVIDGAVLMGSGADTVYNFGIITKAVDLGTGEDTYRALGDGLVLDIVSGGADGDTISGASGEDEFYGDSGDDILRGGVGDDLLFGGDDDDVVDGGVGDDVLYGDDNDDRLLGKAGEDILFGGSGADILRGDAGLDVLYGGAGSDRLFGGSGADQFLFTAATDSPDTNAGRDIIRDFEVGIDLIGVSQLSGPAFAFIGSAAFSGTAPELRAVVSASGDTNVYLDTDGNGVADARILVSDVTTLTADDFIL